MSVPTNRTSATIRAAEPRDGEAIARVFLESARTHAELDPERYRVPDAAAVSARYRDVGSSPHVNTVTLVAEVLGAIVGFVDARLEASPDLMHRDVLYCDVSEIAVNESHRSQGIGGQLLSAAEAWGRERGAAFASLEHHVANVRAASFYQGRMGYPVAAPMLIKRL